MVPMRHKHQPIRAIGQKFYVLASAALRGDADVGGTIRDSLDDEIAEAFAQFDIDVRMAAQIACQHSRHEFIHGRGVCIDADMPFYAAGVFADVSPKVLELAQ